MQSFKYLLAPLLTGLILSACGPGEVNSGQSGSSGAVVSTGEASIGGPYELINHDGAVVTEQDFIGRPQLIYFGFGYCPDVCPMALQKMGAAQEKMDPKGNKVNYVFITVDPERDTPESLKQYVTANGFPTGLNGLTGSLDQIETAKKAYRVYAQKAFDPESAGDYTMDHSDIIYLMDENGKFLDIFTGRSTVDDIVARTRPLL